jgi:hypothetical protein
MIDGTGSRESEYSSYYIPADEEGGDRDFETYPRAPSEGFFGIESPPLLLFKEYMRLYSQGQNQE